MGSAGDVKGAVKKRRLIMRIKCGDHDDDDGDDDDGDDYNDNGDTIMMVFMNMIECLVKVSSRQWSSFLPKRTSPLEG